ncbi:PDR/VanB family oxidoreductase [Roseixanthobacter liquoris]|uniref:PDR/VanB family oxidoreductase n=1 Tax=Roseixanthobacter liquoris TaxID=3119921 RepID=UPI003727C996
MTLNVRVRRITYRAEGIVSLELVPLGAEPLPPFTAGAHIEVRLPNGMARQYSLHNRPGERHRYEIAVQREETGRGGSLHIHDQVRAGDVLAISAPRNHFELDEGARHTILVGGGIGITPLIAMATHLGEIGASFALHYCARSRERLAFLEEANALAQAGSVTFHLDGGVPAAGLDTAALLATHMPGTRVYCCGPHGLNTAVQAASAHWPAGAVRFETFAPPSATFPLPPAPLDGEDGAEFEIELASTGTIIPVHSGQSILAALRARGLDAESSCEAGTCGVCKTRLLHGVADHQDFVLSRDEQAEWMMICVSRAKSRRLKLGL